MQRQTVLIDCDPGQDDAVALLMAFASANVLDVRAVTTVAGNVPLALTTRNALAIAELAGSEVPVHAGCPRPLCREPRTAEHVHGSSGLGDVVLPEPQREPAPAHAVEQIVATVRDEPAESVTLCTLGPLTNIALAITGWPEVMRRVQRIVAMGGVAGMGNVTPAAEFNFFADPHAADIVLRSGIPIVLFGLDVTHQVRVDQERARALAAIGTRAASLVSEMLGSYDRAGRARDPAGGAPLHDPCVIAHLLDEGLFDGHACHVTIDRTDGPSAGRSNIDLFGRSGQTPNALVMTSADAAGFFALLEDRLARLQ